MSRQKHLRDLTRIYKSAGLKVVLGDHLKVFDGESLVAVHGKTPGTRRAMTTSLHTARKLTRGRTA